MLRARKTSLYSCQMSQMVATKRVAQQLKRKVLLDIRVSSDTLTWAQRADYHSDTPCRHTNSPKRYSDLAVHFQLIQIALNARFLAFHRCNRSILDEEKLFESNQLGFPNWRPLKFEFQKLKFGSNALSFLSYKQEKPSPLSKSMQFPLENSIPKAFCGYFLQPKEFSQKIDVKPCSILGSK